LVDEYRDKLQRDFKELEENKVKLQSKVWLKSCFSEYLDRRNVERVNISEIELSVRFGGYKAIEYGKCEFIQKEKNLKRKVNYFRAV
jgi:hypothetical protein